MNFEEMAGGEVENEAGVLRLRRVLLVEDNVVNRKVAMLQLQKLGYSVECVSTGQEAISAFLKQGAAQYGLILMDCQMPEMDGFEATRFIRQAEQSSGGHVPIVAITANAMQGDREECLAAGMDDYIAKPVTLARLRETMERWWPDYVQPSTTSLDLQALETLRKLVKGAPPDFLASLIDEYCQNAERSLQALRQAIAAGEAEPVFRIAHSLKSSSAYYGATTLSTLLRELELQAHSGKLEEAPERLAAIENEYQRVKTSLEAEKGRSQT